MAIPRVIDLKTEPVVGRTYRVPCAPIRPSASVRWIPVFGGPHNDSKLLGFPEDHWHIDWRFMTKRKWDAAGCLGDFEAAVFLGKCFGWPVTTAQAVGPVRERRLVCRRPMPPIGYGMPATLKIMEDAYAGASVSVVRGCRVCPHRGLGLDSLPREPDGTVVCRGHGLAFSPNGRVIRRVTKDAEKRVRDFPQPKER